MAHRRCHEAGVGQRDGGVIVAVVPSAAAVRDHDQRQASPCDGRITCDSLRGVADGLPGCGSVGRIPDSGRQWRFRAIGDLDLFEADVGGKSRRSKQTANDSDHSEYLHGRRSPPLSLFAPCAVGTSPTRWVQLRSGLPRRSDSACRCKYSGSDPGRTRVRRNSSSA
ncbi:conserved hypothetical protein [Ricinus communis]|uniref:Uncharacterized protein n=1 Tax=Ricinus communis TaxID=3988 RepID=B9TG44_RICCO|nr:conserved hypothetical protein [Ricinus communis]